ncbi:hypothetical protein PFISCL1PPCAC_23073, partial [Pristionchus fissidentatus]
SEKQHTKSVDIEEENEPIEKEKEENKRIEKEKEESRSDIGESAKQHEKSVDIEEENERIQKEKEEIERIEKEKEQCRSDIGERNQSGSAVLKSSVGTLNEKTTSKKRFETIPSGIHRIRKYVVHGPHQSSLQSARKAGPSEGREWNGRLTGGGQRCDPGKEKVGHILGSFSQSFDVPEYY